MTPQSANSRANSRANALPIVSPGRYASRSQLATSVSPSSAAARATTGLDFRPELDRSHRSVFDGVAFYRQAFRDAAFRDQRHVVDFGQIVIFGRQPENRNAVHPGSGRLSASLTAVKRLENRKQRPAEKSDLLSGNRRERPASQPVDVGERLRAGSPLSILPTSRISPTFWRRASSYRTRCASSFTHSEKSGERG